MQKRLSINILLPLVVLKIENLSMGVAKNEMTTTEVLEIPVELVQLTGGKMYVKNKWQGKEITQMALMKKKQCGTPATMKAEKK
jgi:hypothetical protein